MNKNVFIMPKTVSVSGRSSTITKACVDGIIPSVKPTEKQVLEVLEILGMTEDNVRCAYCGDKCTLWDHFRPLVNEKIATGYYSEIYNLIPCCNTCNSSKGNTPWKKWMLSKAEKSPKSRNVVNLEDKIKRIETFEAWSESKVSKLDMEKIVGKEAWEQYWTNRDKILKMLDDFNDLQKQFKKQFQNSVDGVESIEVDSVKPSEKKLSIAFYFLTHDCCSLKEIEKEILGIENGKGSSAKYHLDSLGITSSKKGILLHNSIQNELQNATGKYYNALLEIQACYYQ